MENNLLSNMEYLKINESAGILYTQTIERAHLEKTKIPESNYSFYNGKLYHAVISQRITKKSLMQPIFSKKEDGLIDLNDLIDFTNKSLIILKNNGIKTLNVCHEIPIKSYLASLACLFPPFGKIEPLEKFEYEKVKKDLAPPEGLEIKYIY